MLIILDLNKIIIVGQFSAYVGIVILRNPQRITYTTLCQEQSHRADRKFSLQKKNYLISL